MVSKATRDSQRGIPTQWGHSFREAIERVGSRVVMNRS